jgi:hypothetical protein
MGMRRAKAIVPMAVLALAGAGLAVRPRLIEQRKSQNEIEAMRVLMGLAIAEARFREHHPELRYGTLDELLDAELVGKRMRGACKDGYLFHVALSTTTSEFLWFATAAPATSDSGYRVFFNNQAGCVFYTTAPAIRVDPATCQPEGAIPTSFSKTDPDWD